VSWVAAEINLCRYETEPERTPWESWSALRGSGMPRHDCSKTSARWERSTFTATRWKYASRSHITVALAWCLRPHWTSLVGWPKPASSQFWPSQAEHWCGHPLPPGIIFVDRRCCSKQHAPSRVIANWIRCSRFRCTNMLKTSMRIGARSFGIGQIARLSGKLSGSARRHGGSNAMQRDFGGKS
jgi:hypothetical protein